MMISIPPLHGNQRRSGIPEKTLMILIFLTSVLSSAVFAQLFPEEDGGELPSYAKRYELTFMERAQTDFPALEDSHPAIMITGYWPPTNEMIRHFSSNPSKNPDGWKGKNWEDRGYDIYAFFPEFPYGLGKGEGEFEVDYQDTSHDFWYFVQKIKPVAIITTGRAGKNTYWTFEGGARYFALDQWIPDFLSPYRPTEDLPVSKELQGRDRLATLPMTDMVERLRRSDLPILPEITKMDTSRYLCNFIGYHAIWYKDFEKEPEDREYSVKASGHIHVGYEMSLETAKEAMEVTLRELIDHLD